MANSWIFPSNNFGTVKGINEAGIETFKGSPFRSLAREICQNSMDARRNVNEPVVVEFSSFSIAVKDIPDVNRLQNAILSCLSFWEDNNKTTDFFKKAKSIMESGVVYVMRISDFNTTGLQGSDKEFNTPWHNLVKAAGVSGKEGSAGGSFGIGKSATFACSDLRTIFYATKDIDGLSAFQGIANLVSFREKGLLGLYDKDSITSGTGYYSSDRRNNPVRMCCSLDPSYSRNEYGTDIFILGFHKSSDWKTEIITSILEEFLIAIYNNELVIKIDGTTINSENLKEIIESYKETAKTAYNYFQVLTDEKSVVIEHEFAGLGTIELRILIKPEMHRKVMMCRKNGMKIFDKANISSTIQFAGICILKDEKINEYFRDMENPQHNAWEPERHNTDSKTKAKNNILTLNRFIKNSVIDMGKKTTVDEIDAEGMGEYFADTEFMDTENQKKDEAISSQTSDIEINVSTPNKKQIGYEATLDGNSKSQPDDDSDDDTGYGDTGSKDKHDNKKNKTNTGTGFGGGEGENPGTHGSGNNSFPTGFGDSERPVRITSIGTMAVRLFLTDRENSIYNLIFTPLKNAGRGYLQIDLSGEQKNVEASVINATELKTNAALLCKGNKIFLNSIERNIKNKISFQIEYAEECSLEVKLYGYSS